MTKAIIPVFQRIPVTREELKEYTEQIQKLRIQLKEEYEAIQANFSKIRENTEHINSFIDVSTSIENQIMHIQLSLEDQIQDLKSENSQLRTKVSDMESIRRRITCIEMQHLEARLKMLEHEMGKLQQMAIQHRYRTPECITSIKDGSLTLDASGFSKVQNG